MNRGFLIWQSVLAALQIAASSANLADLIGDKPYAVVAIVVAALQGGTAIYAHGLMKLPPGQPVVEADTAVVVSDQAPVLAPKSHRMVEPHL